MKHIIILYHEVVFPENKVEPYLSQTLTLHNLVS